MELPKLSEIKGNNHAVEGKITSILKYKKLLSRSILPCLPELKENNRNAIRTQVVGRISYDRLIPDLKT